MYSALDSMWVFGGIILIFMMQPGFAMLEAGFSRAKNSANIVLKNVVDFLIACIGFFAVGYGLMYLGDNPFIGEIQLFSTEVTGKLTIPDAEFVLFQLVFCGTSATIVSGAMSGRMKFSAYCIFSLCMSCLIYPVSGHWAWGNGFLQNIGFHDFAGGAVVHTVGGVAAFVGAAMLGPRIGKYTKDGYSNAVQGHNMVFSALGVFLLWVGWIGFNACSTLSVSGDEMLMKIAQILLNTFIAGSASGLTMLCLGWFRYHKPDVSMTLNGVVGGLVAITAGCDCVTVFGAFLIGVLAALVLLFAIEVIDLFFHVDDPVGASAVHGICGILGVLMTGFLSKEAGLFYGHGTSLLKAQVTGVLAIVLWVAVTAFVIMWLLKATIGLRVSKEAEIMGLDRSEHGFMGANPFMAMNAGNDEQSMEQIGKFVEEIEEQGYESDHKVRSVVIITRESKLNDLKTALNKIGISGITVSNVLGCGVQKGHTADYYRGVETEVELLPKVRVEIVISGVPLEAVLSVAKKVLKTGNVGDGKIFVYSVDHVIRIRTEEEGEEAL